MRVGVLYESDEWSDHELARALREELAQRGEGAADEVELIDMEEGRAIERALGCDALLSRVFASAEARGHLAALRHTEELIEALEGTDILLVNCPQAHSYETSKRLAGATLAQAGIAVPPIRAIGEPGELDPATFAYPCVIKPDRGGRTLDTAILRDAQQAAVFLVDAPARTFIVEDFIEPAEGYVARLEIVGGKVALAVKRSVAANGLSAYRFGSTYAPYDDLSQTLRAQAERAAATLGFTFGSFDVIERDGEAFFIDANSVSNVSEDCTALFGVDLLRLHARAFVAILQERFGA